MKRDSNTCEREKMFKEIFLKVWSEKYTCQMGLYEKAGFSLASKEGEWSIMVMLIDEKVGICYI